MRLVPHIALFLAFSIVPAAGFAGTLCGNVRDSQTNSPIAHAGIFVRTQAGAFTGIYGASDAAGAFCIDRIPAGTYDIEVRVDDHRVAYLRSIVVGATTQVEIPASRGVLELRAPSPNPATIETRIGFALAAPARVTLAICDVRGRAIRTWIAMLPAGAHSLDWDLRDTGWRPVPAGIYFVRLDANGERRVRTITRIP